MFEQDDAANLALAILDFRRQRASEFGSELFAEPAWEFLLELFIADAKGERITGRHVAAKCNLSRTLTSLWLKHLSAAGLVKGDGDGDLDDLLTLAPKAIERMERLLGHARVLCDELPAANVIRDGARRIDDPPAV